MNEAIKLAIKGGWGAIPTGEDWTWTQADARDAVLDPSFWQALGKALGWKGVMANTFDSSYDKEMWQWNAIKYFELKLTGGDEEKFWEELLK